MADATTLSPALGQPPELGIAEREQRFPCVGIALLYSARDGQGRSGMGSLLHQVATTDMSLKGLAFDVAVPLAVGDTLMVLVGQPDTEVCEQLFTSVRWCRELSQGHFRVGVQIGQSSRVLQRLSADGGVLSKPIQIGLPVPASVELVCPACGAHAVFELVANQPVAGGKQGLMPLYDCSLCETTRSIMGLLAYARQAVVPPVSHRAGAETGSTRFANAVSDNSLPYRNQPVNKEGQAMTLKRILYAEDEPDIQAVAKLALEMVGGFEVLICGNGVEALQKVGDFAPQLILLDVMMPGMDGPTTLQNLRANAATAAIPVIFLTAKVQPPEVVQYQAMGALDVIAKPFDPMTLAAQVKAIWGRSHG